LNISSFTHQTANRIGDKIKEEIKNKMISVKLDIGTKSGRSVLGVNIQYYLEGEKRIVIRTFEMIEIFTIHTAENLRTQLFELFAIYEIDLANIYSYTMTTEQI
jgi:hypothetical protein